MCVCECWSFYTVIFLQHNACAWIHYIVVYYANRICACPCIYSTYIINIVYKLKIRTNANNEYITL